MAGKVISGYSVVLGASTGALVSGLNASVSAVTKAASSITSSVSSIGSTIAKFTGIGAVIGAIAGGAGFGALLTSQSEAIDSTAKLSDRLGVTTESLVGLQHAAKLAGVSSESLTGGLEHYLKNVSAAAGGNAELSTAFAKLGLDAKQLINLPTDQAIGLIGDALNAIKNPADKAAAEVSLFGKSGQELEPLLASGSAGILQMTKDAQLLGITFSRTDASKVEAANDALSRIGDVVNGVFTQIAIAVAPIIEGVANSVTDVGIKIVSIVKTYLPTVVGWFEFAWNEIASSTAAILGPIVGWISDNLDNIIDVVSTAIAVVYTYIGNVLSGVWSLIVATVNNIGSALGAVGVTTESVGEAFQTMGQAVVIVLTTVGYTIKNWQLAMGIVGLSVAATVVTIGNQISYVFTEVIPTILKWFADNWAKILTDVFNMSTTIFSNLSSNIVNILKNLPGLISGSVSFVDIWTPLTDGFQATLTDLPKIAERQIGPLEKQLNSDLAQDKGKFTDGLVEAIANQDILGKKIGANLKGAFKGVGAAANASAPTLPKSPVDVPESQAVTKETAKIDLGTNIASGTAQAQSLRDAVLSPPGGNEATPAAAQQATVETPKAIRESADKYQPTLIALVQMLVPLVEQCAANKGPTFQWDD